MIYNGGNNIVVKFIEILDGWEFDKIGVIQVIMI